MQCQAALLHFEQAPVTTAWEKPLRILMGNRIWFIATDRLSCSADDFGLCSRFLQHLDPDAGGDHVKGGKPRGSGFADHQRNHQKVKALN